MDMATYVDRQFELQGLIHRQLVNFKKDGRDRKENVEYFKRKWSELEEAWSEFQENHGRIISEVSATNDYFTAKCYERTTVDRNALKDLINQGYQEALANQGSSATVANEAENQRTEQSDEQDTGTGTRQQDQQSRRQPESQTYQQQGREQPRTNQGTLSKVDETLRKQQVNFKAFARTTDNIKVDEMTDKWEFEDALKSLETRWSAIDSLHWEIDSELEGKNLSYEATFTKYETLFNKLKKEINKKMWSVSHREKCTPKLDIPVFSGNYNNWVSFKDLFNEAIHNNPTLSNAQRMQFLKSKIRGEAERLIQHLTISTENYLTCWEILNNRYNNKKQIFTSHMNILFGLPNIQIPSVTQLKKMHDVTTETMHAIKNLGIDISTWDPILVHILSNKLDSETYTDYIESLKNSRELPVFQEFQDFLESKFTALENSRRKQDTSLQKTNKPQASVSNIRKYNFHNYNNNWNNGNQQVAKSFHVSGFNCPLCKNEHGIYNCKTFLQMSPEQKLNTIKKLRICINCLFSHNGQECNSTKTCRKCTRRHNTLIHEALEKSMNSNSSSKSTQNSPTANTIHGMESEDLEILLATAQVKVLGADGVYRNMRALIDQGSQISIITEQAAQVLGIKRGKCKGVIYGIGQKENNCKGKLNITCSSMYSNYTFDAEVIIMNNLVKNLPNKTFTRPSWSVTENINLADPEFYISRPVDLLLGADIYSNIILNGIIKGDDVTQPMAQQTQLGWLLCGSARTFQCNVVLNNIEDIQNFWEVEDVTEDEVLSSEEVQCVNYFQETTIRIEDGRYEVRLPMKNNFENELGESKKKALAQFRNIERKLEKEEHLAQAYKTFMNEYLDLKHMKPAECNTTPECYLPHHGVQRAESTTTKYRVVFNASAKTSTGFSLNDLMYKGPNLQQDLQSLLLKWRQYRYAFTADIEKMYRQILVSEVDQQLQKIIWRESPEQPLQSYQLTTVTYGTKSAPFLAMMVLKRLAMDERNNYPEAAKILDESFYMDDLVHGSHTISDGKKVVNDLNNLLQTGGFNLRKWSSNNNQILEDLTTKQQNNGDNIFNFKTENTSKTLGLCWNATEDTFTFKCDVPEQRTKVTKRILLSEISKLFDPLGWLAPVVTKLKLLFQNVWKTDTQWDEQVSDNIYGEWSKLRADINKINECKIPRWILCNEHDVIELHGFCDASNHAYACVIYARIKNQLKIVIVAAKTKLVPLKKTLTLPKLELSGAYLLTKLMRKIKLALKEHEIETYGWTDSQVVLGWLHGEPSRWKPFVANRVQKVTEVMPSSEWRYVKTAENPADAASRGIYPSQLKEHPLWWQGPSWLRTLESEKIEKHTYSTEEEKKKCRLVNVVQDSNNENIIDSLLEKHSSIEKITRILAWIQRAMIPKHERQTGYLKLQELRKAKCAIVKHVQRSEFSTEMEHLGKHGKVHSKSKLLNLQPFIDRDNILRVGGRLEQANICFEMKHPKIIPNNTYLGKLLIEQSHRLTFHGGPRLTLAYLRREYWITGGCNTVKKQLRKCITCRKQEGKKQQQLMGDLPAARVNPASPFYHTGVDYTGFVEVKANKGRGIKTLKGYVAIFVCMVTKAVHLELVTDLTSSAFLAALRRMAARRGSPRHIYSDNGTNFVGANRVLQEELQQLQQVFSDSFLTEVTEMNIEWHFNAPAWPSAGGLWERAVRSLKHHLKRVVGEQKLTYEEYATILAQLEACLNSRPLCALTEDIRDIDFLTPAHFLTGRSGVTVIETAEDARTRWNLTQKIFQDIWKRWKVEYLSQLTARNKWQTSRQNIKIGDVVIIHEENLPPGKWAMGRVIDAHPGDDGYVRVVTLKTKNGIIKRPVVKLSVLPLDKQTKKNEQTIDEENQDKEKKEKHGSGKRTSFISMLITCWYLLTLISTGHCFKMTPINEKQGLYFDKLANMRLVRDEWKIITYYNMNPYWKGILAYEKYYQHLQTICQAIKNSTHCDIIMLQLRNAHSELEHNNKLLLQQQMNSGKFRRRRGLINGVGYLANSLFGVLDDRFAEQYQKDIDLVRENEKHLALLWKNQTTIVEAEYNLIKRTEETMERQHKLVNQHLLNLEKITNTMMKEVNKIELMSEFSLSSMAANNILTHLTNIQDTLLDMTTNVLNGKLNIHLIDPQQLQNQLNIISGLLAKELTLPIDNIQTNMQNIYHLLKIKVKMTKVYYIFEIRIPLISRDNFDLYNLLPVPHQTGKSMMTIVPIESHVAVNLQKDSYLPVTQTDMDHCVLRDSTTYLCQLKTPIYKMMADKDLCVKNENQPNKCKTSIAACQNKWISLVKANQFLYFCCGWCQLRTLCSDQVTAHQLTGTNIINIAEGCLVKTDNFSIYTHKTQESKMEIRYKIEAPEIAPINNVMNITMEQFTEDNYTNTVNEQLFKDIEHKIKTMKENEALIENISVHDIHHYIVIYCLWGVAAIVAVIFVCRRIRRQRQTEASAQAAVEAVPEGGPAPAARSNNQHSGLARVNECSESVVKERFYKNQGTTPVLRKIAFSDD